MADPFVQRMADRLSQVPGVMAVHFGGSRAAGAAGPASDWDFSIYYRGTLDVAGIRGLGWPGVISEVGGWGPVMNGGAWLTFEGEAVDVHYRDLAEIDQLRQDASAGRFTVHRSPFFVAGIPSYVPLAELAGGVTLRGELPRPEFPPALRDNGCAWWRSEAEKDLGYAARIADHAPAAAFGLLTRALVEAAHARACLAGKWVINEKRLMTTAGLESAERELIKEFAEAVAIREVADWMAKALDLRPFQPR